MTPQDDTTVGFCRCGCGQKTAIAAKTDTRRGYVKGEPRPYARGHSSLSGRAGFATCEQCGKTFRRHTPNPDRFCSLICRYTPKPIEPDPANPDVCRVPLSQGAYALIDCADAARVGVLPWSVHKTKQGIYARNTTNRIYLHRFILGITDPKVRVDHQDGNGLNCRRQNIREATPSLNTANAGKRPGSNPYKGIVKRGNRWIARIRVDYVTRHLGTFDTPEDAARAYDAAALMNFGEFAHLNFPGT